MVSHTTPARRPELRDERGDTLIELLITVVIMGLAVVAILGAIANSVALSAAHRKQAVAGAYIRAYAEAVESAVAGSPSKYSACAGTSTYASVYSPPDAHYQASVTKVRYWKADGFSDSCGPDTGVQLVYLKIATTDGKVSETLTIVIREPCRSQDDFPQDPACTA
jgi:type II secretory pathway pseudopilin PulG